MTSPSSVPGMRKRTGVLRAETINMSHGSGGKAMRDLIEDVFLKSFDNPQLAMLEDQARIDLSALTALGNRLAMTTDSYVVDPIFFNGGDIGKLAVCGTVNDLAVGGAIPLYLTCGMIIEEGLSVEDLRRIVTSMKAAADAAGVTIVTGDTKVVDRGAADKVFINTAGVGVIPQAYNVSSFNAKPGDVVLINGYIGDHGAAIVGARGDLAIENDIHSDCQPLNHLIQALLKVCPEVHCMRDATRGGVASVLNEFAISSRVCIKLQETAIPVRTEVRGMCEILGLDPLYLANEGKVVVVVAKEQAAAVLAAMRAHEAGVDSAIIGEVSASPEETVILKTSFGGERIVDMLVGDQLPRIC
ncbi:MAG: hydrogenase expression/formation protein HypE [Cyanobacteria bacterium SZAS LIN-3]|nr:hydrogenase expression/formation protein HypE [Cyanobacteria bacterium SZAS LIN-3]